ncbi:phage baseplate assembly protein V [Pandoraea sp. SD6-2]|uniref:phage baseplate assembly protein V n=1 Tax=Pandoraea sp. SD6-2 TaxID=1286093 RepID=UPI00032FB620|nr:phage baseplate assembly protein V [Pandoraea sp. SD6-2]EON13093.1 phage baseplate assembly protein V [Pandoraea sp. SD6-2]
MIEEIDKRIRRALASFRHAFRGLIGLAKTDGPVVIIQGEGLAGEPVVDAELFQHYGYTSAPPSGTMMIVVPIGGRTSHSIVIATEHGQYRLKALKPGEVALYSDEGDSVHLARGRVMNITTKTLNITAEEAVNIDSPKVNVKHLLNVAEQITGQGGLSVSGGEGVVVDGSMKVKGDVEIGGKSFLGHKHPVPGNVTDVPS